MTYICDYYVVLDLYYAVLDVFCAALGSHYETKDIISYGWPESVFSSRSYFSLIDAEGSTSTIWPFLLECISI